MSSISPNTLHLNGFLQLSRATTASQTPWLAINSYASHQKCPSLLFYCNLKGIGKKISSRASYRWNKRGHLNMMLRKLWLCPKRAAVWPGGSRLWGSFLSKSSDVPPCQFQLECFTISAGFFHSITHSVLNLKLIFCIYSSRIICKLCRYPSCAFRYPITDDPTLGCTTALHPRRPTELWPCPCC